mgnify:CR=1 FL=1
MSLGLEGGEEKLPAKAWPAARYYYYCAQEQDGVEEEEDAADDEKLGEEPLTS